MLDLAELAWLRSGRLRRQGCLDLGLALAQARLWVAGVLALRALTALCYVPQLNKHYNPLFKACSSSL